MEIFDFLNAINHQKTNIMRDDPQAVKEYNAFRINKFLSQHVDSILYVNEMNLKPHCDVELQFDYFINSLRERKRRAQKWYVSDLHDDIEVVKEYYGYSTSKAKVALSLLNDDDLTYIKKRLYKGGFSHG
tara:strand:+ start:297 stop:686 length:390 start_codon:yes stop_codon:yes gene_type:complete